jgi:hypothetical protein
LLEIQEKEIDGRTFRFNPLTATEARRTLVGMIQRFGGSLASGIDGLSGSDVTGIDGDTEVTEMLGKVAGSLSGIIRQFTMNLTPEYYENLTELFGKRTELHVVSGGGQSKWMALNKGMRDLEFGTSLMTEAKWVWWCLEVQYSDFFELARSGAQKAVALGLAAKTEKSPSSSHPG